MLDTVFMSKRSNLLAYAQARLSRAEDAEDAVSDTYVRARLSWAQCRNKTTESGVENWIFGILSYVCNREYAKKTREVTLSTDAWNAFVMADTYDDVNESLLVAAHFRLRHAGLRQTEREMLFMRLNGMSRSEIAKEFNLTIGQTIHQLASIRKCLRECSCPSPWTLNKSQMFLFNLGKKVFVYRAPPTWGSRYARTQLAALK